MLPGPIRRCCHLSSMDKIQRKLLSRVPCFGIDPFILCLLFNMAGHLCHCSTDDFVVDVEVSI